MKYSSLIPLIAIAEPTIVQAEVGKWYTAGDLCNGKMHAEPSLKSKVVGVLSEGEQYREIKTISNTGVVGEWLLIETKSGKKGWIICGCYLTTACVWARGLGDDCLELRMLRQWRDLYVASFAEGRQTIQEYYRFAPAVVEAIARSGRADVVYEEIYTDLVAPTVRLILERAFDTAYIHYKHVSLELRKVWLAE